MSDLQENLSVTDERIVGTLKYLDEGSIAGYWGNGNFMALDLSDNDYDGLTSVMVGMEPSEGSGLQELIEDEEKAGVFKVTDKDSQTFKVVSTDGTSSLTQTFDLSGLTTQGE